MIHLGNLKPAKGAIRKRRRVGRGPGSGRGKTSARGMNGQRSRNGYSRNYSFEGGQMPLIRRIPKRGFTNIFKKEYNIVNLDAIATLKMAEVKFEDYFAKRLAHNKRVGIKVLGTGELKRKVKVHAHAFSKSALSKIEKAGGEAVVIGMGSAT